MLPTSTEVLVVGAGPAGLTTAVGLAHRGHLVTVVDAQPAGDNTSRACVVHAHTLEVLRPYGVADRLVAKGLQVPLFTMRDRDRILVEVPFDHLPTAYPYTLMVPQSETEATLLARLTELGGQVLRPHRVSALAQDDGGVTATFENGHRMRAGYVVGADGMHSTVREQAGIGFAGGDYAESFALADVRLTEGIPEGEVILYYSPAGMLVVAPIPGGIHRVVATVDEAPRRPDAAFVAGLIASRGPRARTVGVRELVWGSRFRLHHRVADTFRSGRFMLVGDAGHVHSPAGGQGMNTGITDATVLADALAGVLDGGSPDLLDAYAARRRPVAVQVVAMADRLTRLANMGPRARAPRNLALRAVGHSSAFRRRLAWQLSGLVHR